MVETFRIEQMIDKKTAVVYSAMSMSYKQWNYKQRAKIWDVRPYNFTTSKVLKSNSLSNHIKKDCQKGKRKGVFCHFHEMIYNMF